MIYLCRNMMSYNNIDIIHREMNRSLEPRKQFLLLRYFISSIFIILTI